MTRQLSDPARQRLVKHLLPTAAIEAVVVIGGVAMALRTGNWMWAIAAAALGTLVLFLAIARAKQDEG